MHKVPRFESSIKFHDPIYDCASFILQGNQYGGKEKIVDLEKKITTI